MQLLSPILKCMEKQYQCLLHVFALSISEAEMVVGWARSHYLSSAVNPSIKGDRLIIPRER
jgi:hypothetical protein